jgi:hypothetical protein
VITTRAFIALCLASFWPGPIQAADLRCDRVLAGCCVPHGSGPMQGDAEFSRYDPIADSDATSSHISPLPVNAIGISEAVANDAALSLRHSERSISTALRKHVALPLVAAQSEPVARYIPLDSRSRVGTVGSANAAERSAEKREPSVAWLLALSLTVVALRRVPFSVALREQ